MSPQDRKRGDMSCLFCCLLVIIHLRQHIPTNLSILFRNMKQFRPCEVVVEIVVEVIILGETPQVAVLHLVKIGQFGSSYGWHLIDYKKISKM